MAYQANMSSKVGTHKCDMHLGSTFSIPEVGVLIIYRSRTSADVEHPEIQVGEQ